MQTSFENSDNYFDNEERTAVKVWKTFTMEELMSFIASKKGELFSSLPLNVKYKKIRHGIVYICDGLEYHIGLC